MRDIVRVAILAIFGLVGLALTACGPLIENTENIGKIFGALSFEADPRSGDTSDQEYSLSLITRVESTNSKANLEDLRRGADTELQAVLDACAPPPPRPTRYKWGLPIDPAGAIVAVGQLAFERVVAGIQGKIEQLKERGHASYSIRRAWDGGPIWQHVDCIVLRRVLTKKAYAELRKVTPPSEKVSRVRMTMVLQRRELMTSRGTSGSILAPVYARVENSVAETAFASSGKKASIRLNVTAVITALTGSKEGKTAVGEVVNFAFKPIVAPLGELAKTCRPWMRGADPLEFQICDHGTGLFPDPPRGAALHVNFVITETGSALTEAESALVALAAVKKAAQPAVTDILKQAAAGL